MAISSTMRWNSLAWRGNLLSQTKKTSRSAAVFQCRSTAVRLWHGQDRHQVSQRKVRAFQAGFASGHPSPMRSAPCLLCLSHHNHTHHRKFPQQSVHRSFSPHPSRPIALQVVRQAVQWHISAQPAVTLRWQVIRRWKALRRVSVAVSAIILRASAAPLPRLSQLCRRFHWQQRQIRRQRRRQ